MSTSEVQQVLKDAGVPTADMGIDEMRNIYKAISRSKAGDIGRNDNDGVVSPEKNAAAAAAPKKKPALCEYMCAERLDKLTFHDLPPVGSLGGVSLRIIPPPPSTPLSVLCDPTYTVMQRMQYLSDYQDKISERRRLEAAKSWYAAPQPAPVRSCVKFNGTLRKYSQQEVAGGGANEEGDAVAVAYVDDPEDLLAIYTTRAGRQLKRRHYSDDIEKNNNNSDLNAMSTSKRNKSNERDSMESSRPDEQQQTPSSSSVNKLSRRKPLSQSNAEIIQRSRLFSPVAAAAASSSRTRCEMMFDNLKDAEREKQTAEVKLDQFTKTLSPESPPPPSSEAASIDNLIIDDDDDFIETPAAVIRKRITPPRRTFRPRTKQQQKRQLSLEQNLNKIEKLPEIKLTRNSNSMNSSRVGQEEPSLAAASSNQLADDDDDMFDITSNTKQSIDCPICSRSFSESAIEMHAATCGDNRMSPPSAVATPTDRSGSVRNGNVPYTCACDETFASPDKYTEHIKICMQRK